MFARSFASAALAGAIVLAPTAALATAGTYPAPSDSLTCSATQVPVGTEFTCTGTGPDGIEVALQATTSGEDVTFVAGTVTSPVQTITGGEATWTVQAPAQAGEIGFSLLYFDESASAWTSYDTATVTVVADSTDDDSLAATGFENAGLGAGAGVLLVAGAATVFVAARRRASQNV